MRVRELLLLDSTRVKIFKILTARKLLLACLALPLVSCASQKVETSVVFETRTPATTPSSIILPYVPVTADKLPLRNSWSPDNKETTPADNAESGGGESSTVRKTIVVIGDSLTEPSVTRLRGFSDKRCEFIVDAKSGRTTSEAVSVLESLKTKYTSKDPKNVVFVIALGTNDSSQESQYKEKLSSVIKTINEDSRVYWMTTYRSVPLYSQFRAVLSLATESGRIYILDWAAQLQANPSIAKSDGTHLTEGGYRFRSDFLKLHTCDNHTD